MSRLPKSPEKLLERLEWTVLRRLDGLLQGEYRTLFKGFGLDLADLREYEFHDDVRNIDWNVTARLQTPYVREYNEDREINAWFLLDISPSIDFGSVGVKKLTILTEFVAVLGRLLTRTGNRVGAILYNGRNMFVVPARGGKQHILYLLHMLASQSTPDSAPTTDLSELIKTALNVIKRRSLVFLVSDFFTSPGWEKPVGMLAQRHETLGVRLFDPLEIEIPDMGIVSMTDAETGGQLLVDTHSRRFRKAYAAEARSHQDHLRDVFSAGGVDAIELSTDDDLVEVIMRFAAQRKRQRQITASERARIAKGGANVVSLG